MANINPTRKSFHPAKPLTRNHMPSDFSISLSIVCNSISFSFNIVIIEGSSSIILEINLLHFVILN